MTGAPGRRRILAQAPAIAVLVLGLTLTAFTVWQLDRLIAAKDHERFTNSADRLLESIQRRLETYTDMLRAGAGMIDVSGTFDHRRFRTFVRRLDLETRYPGIQGVGFSARILPSELDATVRLMQREWPDFRVWPGEPRAEYHAILDLEPADVRNRRAIGYDMFTDATRRAAMERARDTGDAAASGPVTLVQEVDDDKQPGFLIYMPAYNGGGVPATVEERRRLLIGFVYSPFRAGDLFQGILGDQSARAGFQLVDVAEPAVALHATSEMGTPAFTLARTLDAGGRQWRATFFSLPALERSSTAELVPVAAWIGVAMTLVVAILVGLQSAARARLEAAEQRAREHAAAMEQARAEAERVNHMKDEFLATLSHELRTPLNAMLGWLQILQRGGVPEERRAQALDTVIRNAEIQSKLIDDLLDMSRIISGRLRMEREVVRLQDVIDAAVNILRAAAEAKAVTIYTSYDAVPPIIADGSRLQQVVWNLLANAVKFTPAGGHIGVSLTRTAGHAEIEVRDTGVGIPTAFLPHVFDPFRQADVSTGREHGGLGLGLSIVKSLVEVHGGSVEAKSDGTGKGAAFLVRLPIIDASDPGGLPVSKAARL